MPKPVHVRQWQTLDLAFRWSHHRRSDRSSLPSAQGSFKKEDVFSSRLFQRISARPEGSLSRAKPVRASSFSFGRRPAASSTNSRHGRRWIVRNIVSTRSSSGLLASQVSQGNNLSAATVTGRWLMRLCLTNAPRPCSLPYRWHALPPTGSRISRATLADFMIATDRQPEWIKKGVYISW